MCLCISVCARPNVCVQLCFKYMDIFSLDGEVHFLSWLYTSSVLSIQNINLNDVLFLFSFQFLFIVLAVVAVVYCYLRSAIRIFIATSLLCMWRRGMCTRPRAHVCVICAYMCVCIIFLLYLLLISFVVVVVCVVFCFVF